MDVLACSAACTLKAKMIWAFDGASWTFFVALVLLREEDGLYILGISVVTAKACCRARAGVAGRLTADALSLFLVGICSIWALFIALESEWVSPRL